MKKRFVIGDKHRIALVYRPDTAPAVNLAKTLAQWLKERNYKVFTAPEQKPIQGTVGLKRRSALEGMGLVIVLGGDGTYLRAAQMLQGKCVPILGVNLGSLGFLTPIRAEELFSTVEQALQNKMELMPRSMIQVQLLRNGKVKHDLMALNDVVIERGSLSQLINISIYCEKMLVSEIKADGLIIASPTGSTAYNLAAGGPILHPAVRSFVVTPIAAHSLTSRPLIFPDDIQLNFKLVGKLHPGSSLKRTRSTQDQAHFVVDGVKVDQISEGDQLVIRRSKMDHFMLRDPRQNYFHLLREKLKFGDRA
ncbi:MAG: NAD(+) kinase [Bdellovibrio sp. CG10_big_fil_rev_8_21_14_0_10_47_8]|nr:MAG: NAD(+) kinase [Bdellovibrio sp. CG10_big_fil_rev_8_21_14_0_10_47_8]